MHIDKQQIDCFQGCTRAFLSNSHLRGIPVQQPKRRTFLNIYTFAEGIMNSVRSLQRSKGDVSVPIKYMYS